MISSLSGTYFQAYQLTCQVCKQVERCYQFELGSDDTFIEFGYWDSLHKGLLAPAGQRGPAGANGQPGATGTPGKNAVSLFVSAKETGTIENQSGGVSVSVNAPGVFLVTFPQQVSDCVPSATINDSSGNGTSPGYVLARVTPDNPGAADVVEVDTWAPSTTSAPPRTSFAFNLTVSCPVS